MELLFNLKRILKKKNPAGNSEGARQETPVGAPEEALGGIPKGTSGSSQKKILEVS